jgi:outer membrane protein
MRNSMKYMLALVLPMAALASAPAFAADTKIGTLRANDLVQQSPQFKAGQDKMKAEFERRANDLEAEVKKLQDDAKKLQKEGDLMSPADRAKAEKDLQTRKIDFDYKSKQFQDDRSNRERQLFTDMMASIKAVIEDVAREKGYDIVVENPVFSNPALDITADVLKRLQAGPAGK